MDQIYQVSTNKTNKFQLTPGKISKRLPLETTPFLICYPFLSQTI